MNYSIIFTEIGFYPETPILVWDLEIGMLMLMLFDSNKIVQNISLKLVCEDKMVFVFTNPGSLISVLYCMSTIRLKIDYLPSKWFFLGCQITYMYGQIGLDWNFEILDFAVQS